MPVVAAILFAVPAPNTATASNATARPPAWETRQDNVFGTLHEGMVMERDADSGDEIIQVRPKPRRQDSGSRQPLVIQPEIKPQSP